MEKETIYLFVGSIGATCALIAFLLNQFDIWKNNDLKYDLLNTIASLLLVIYAILLESVPFLILNVIWGLVSFKDVVKKILTK